MQVGFDSIEELQISLALTNPIQRQADFESIDELMTDSHAQSIELRNNNA